MSLSFKKVERLREPGKYADVGQEGARGLYLCVGKGTSKSWVFRYSRGGRTRYMGLGSARDRNLDDARVEARKARDLLSEGIDPLEAKRAQAAPRARAEAKPNMTFKECAVKYIASHKASWKNPTHAAQWPQSLEAYAYPIIGDLAVDAVDTPLIMKVLEPIWTTKTETASRLRQRIECVLDWAKVKDYRSGENPARWKGHLEHLLPNKKTVAQKKKHPCVHYNKMPQFWGELELRQGFDAKALMLLILTAARSGEIIHARWSEIDNDVWTIPGARMKAGLDHRVPLSPQALAILEELPRESDYIFAGNKSNTHLAREAMYYLLKRMGWNDATVHGFRSSFRDWCYEVSGFPRELAEASLAHQVGDVEASYRRGDALNKRRELMDAWANYVTTPNIIAMKKAG